MLFIFGFSIVTGGIMGCDSAQKVKEALEGGSQTSYCEALCSWASTCAEGHSALDATTRTQRCLQATRESDEKCSLAENGELSVDEILILGTCTDAVEEMSCDSLIGSEDELLYGRPPDLQCTVAYGGVAENGLDNLSNIDTYLTYNEARNAVLSTGAEICEQMADTICDHAVSCLIGDYGIGEAEDILTETCLSQVMGSITDDCIQTGLYDSTLPVNYNLTRYAAESCIDSWEEYGACDIFTTVPPVTCAAAFTDPDMMEDIIGNLLGFALDYGVDF